MRTSPRQWWKLHQLAPVYAHKHTVVLHMFQSREALWRVHLYTEYGIIGLGVSHHASSITNQTQSVMPSSSLSAGSHSNQQDQSVPQQVTLDDFTRYTTVVCHVFSGFHWESKVCREICSERHTFQLPEARGVEQRWHKHYCEVEKPHNSIFESIFYIWVSAMEKWWNWSFQFFESRVLFKLVSVICNWFNSIFLYSGHGAV